MQITLARHSGFCMGVKNAVLKIIHEINSTNKELYMYGPLIHNPQTIDLLHDRGLKTLQKLDDAAGKQIAIRTHGVPLPENRILKNCAERVINLTCPRVARVQAIIKKYSSKGYYTVITGDNLHPEVIGLKSYATAGVTVISDTDKAVTLPESGEYVMVSQTTFDRETFNKIIAELR
jgi:(E)-4-hydroxy-3-methyl-but-2-enyl pyrophosphate reductase